MRQPILLLSLAILPLVAGCWGESAQSVMEKRARAMGDVNKEKEAKAAAMAGGSSPDSAGGAGASLPKSNVPTTPSAANLTPGSANQHVAPPAITAPTAALAANATVEERRARTMENLAKLGQALNAYADAYAGYPVTKTINGNVNPPMSWRVAILPLLGYEKLFKQYRPAEPWDSTSNKQILAQIPPEYQSPDRRDTKTNYLVPLGFEAAFGGGRRLNAGMFEDGPDYTLILVEVDDAHAMEWTRPDDLVVQAGVGTVRSRLGSLRGDGFFAVLANGRVCRIKSDADELALKALFTVSSGDTEMIRDAIQDATAVFVPPPAPVETANSAPSYDNRCRTCRDSGRDGRPCKTNSCEAGRRSIHSRRRCRASRGDHGSQTWQTLFPTPPEITTKRLPVPLESELTAKRAALKELYANDYKKATDAQERRKLAKKLVDSSDEVGEDHAARYALLRVARDVSAQNGDLSDALKTLLQLETKFQIDVPSMRLETLKLFQKSSEAFTKDKELATEAGKLVTEALAVDNYHVAEEALKIEKGAAKRSGDTESLEKAGKLQTWLEAAERAYTDVPKAEARLATGQTDPQASQIVGVYQCLVKGKWEQGLPQLSQSTDRTLRFLAKLDLASAKSPEEVFDLANQYWDLAEHKPDMEEQGLKLRAAYWYAHATKDLPDGLDKIKARKRLAEVIEAYGKEETEKATARHDISTAARTGSSDE